ncbi:MAG: hypothetical protein AAGH74_10195 [Pseudomonadota bacterium]
MIRTVCLAAALSTYGVVAAADQFYVAARAGYQQTSETDFSVLGLGVENEYEGGYALAGAAGYEFTKIAPGIDLRTELEIGYTRSNIDAHTITGLGTFSGASAFGRTETVTGTVNLFGDYAVTDALEVFLGGGVGIASTSFDDHGVAGVGVVMNDDTIGFAYHIGAGIAYDFPGPLTAELSYRFAGTTGGEITAIDGSSSDLDTTAHMVLAGVRIGF